MFKHIFVQTCEYYPEAREGKAKDAIFMCTCLLIPIIILPSYSDQSANVTIKGQL